MFVLKFSSAIQIDKQLDYTIQESGLNERQRFGTDPYRSLGHR